MINSTFRLTRPARQETSVIFASPHSGRDYPADFLAASQLDTAQLRSSEDAYVDRLFARAPLYGAPLLCALAPRAYVDLNRAVDELDPAVIEGINRAAHNPRILSGLGVIPRVVAGSRAIYRGKITAADAQRYFDMAEAAMGAGWVGPGTFRLGASSLLIDLLAVAEGKPASESREGY